MLRILGLVIVFATAGCTTVSYPSKRPMPADYQDQIGGVELVLSDNNLGVGKTWFRTDSSAAGAGYGLIGALTTSVMDAIINSGPSKQAQKAANEVGELVTTEFLNNSFVEAIQAETVLSSASGAVVTITSSKRIQPLSEEPGDGVLSVVLSYSISEEASALRVVADVTYENANLNYVSPYTFESGKIPKEQQDGAIYKNVFTYDSDRLELPVLSPQLKAALATQIRDSFKDENGNLPEEGSKEQRQLDKALETAADDELDKNEASYFLIGHWTMNDAFFVFQEVAKGHKFIAESLIADLSRTDIPSLEGEDQIVSTAADGRTVRIIGNGVGAGSVMSSPGNLDASMSIGNATSFSETNQDRVKALKKAAK